MQIKSVHGRLFADSMHFPARRPPPFRMHAHLGLARACQSSRRMHRIRRAGERRWQGDEENVERGEGWTVDRGLERTVIDLATHASHRLQFGLRNWPSMAT
jgi:hypothetical protein